MLGRNQKYAMREFRRYDEDFFFKVHFILSGDDDETNIRTLTADRRILERGSTDSFIMAVPRFVRKVFLANKRTSFDLDHLVNLIIFVFGMIIQV
jgi:hypothetical protein